MTVSWQLPDEYKDVLVDKTEKIYSVLKWWPMENNYK